MNISINRDVRFWHEVANHLSVAPFISAELLDMRTIVTNPDVIPFANEHGGYLFFCLDFLGRVYDVHAMFRPEGRGRPAWKLAVAALEEMFSLDTRVILTAEVVGNEMSIPPRTCGFECAGDSVITDFGELRTWVLTKDRWLASPARERMVTRCLQ